jgi:transposase-like protein
MMAKNGIEPYGKTMADPISKADSTVRYGTDGTVRYQDSGTEPHLPYAVEAVDKSVVSRSRGRKVFAKKADRFTELNNRGYSAERIAADLGVSARSVQRWRAQTGSRIKPAPAQLPHEAHRRVRALLDDGASMEEAARTVGISSRTIRRWFPDARPWTRSQVGEYAAVCRAASMKHLR